MDGEQLVEKILQSLVELEQEGELVLTTKSGSGVIGIDVTTPSHLNATMHLFRMVCLPCRFAPSSCHGPCSTVAGVCTAAR